MDNHTNRTSFRHTTPVDYGMKGKLFNRDISFKPYSSYPLSIRERRYNRGRRKTLTSIQELVKGIVVSLLIIGSMFKIMSTGIDRTLDNRETMLCESAKVSGNVEYLNKCACFYQGQDITCIR